MRKSYIAYVVCSLLLVAAIILMIPKYSYNDSDTFWHIELGSYMLEHGKVLHHAIHTFYDDQLPYVPHEFAFQIIVSSLYQTLGWPGLYLLTAACLFFLVLGLIRLGRVSRKELGLEEDHPVLLLLAVVAACWIYYVFFKQRPQMVSAVMILWFVIYLREFQMLPRIRYAAALLLLSLGVANFHAGVWPVLAVFTGMALLESLIARNFSVKRMAVFAGVWLIGLLNPGGIKSLFFILTVTENNFNMLINEWQPIQFNKLENLPILLLMLFFATILPHALHRKPYRYFMMLGILYLGIANYKQNLFMWLLIPYFAAVAIEALPWLGKIKFRFSTRSVAMCLIAGLAINAAIVFKWTPEVDRTHYPVEEMDFILGETPDGTRPKVMSTYGSSGYVMFRGGNILTDGRQDPFITEASKGALGWTAFERSMHGYSEYLPDVIAYDKPDYLIVHNNVSWRLRDDWTKLYGQPAFKGTFGRVYRLEAAEIGS